MKKIFFLTAFFLVACTSVSKDINLVSLGSQTSELLIYRGSFFHAAAVSMYIGKDDKYFVSLRNADYAIVILAAGQYTLQAKADASPASKLVVILKPNERTCLSGTPNPQTNAAIVVPILANMIPAFVLAQVECPNDEALKKYRQVQNS